MATYKNVIESEFEDVFNKDHHLKGRWKQDYFKNNHTLVLELGCGKGEYTVGLARLYPDKNFIGIDIKGARMHKGATEALDEGLTNAAFLRTRIEFIQSFFGVDEVDEIWLTFPDPQMKKSTKRLTSSYFLKRYREFLSPTSVIHLKTDSQFLYEYTLELVKLNNLTIKVNCNDLYHSDYVDSILSLQTYYESKWLAKGIPIKYLKFYMGEEKSWKEPDKNFEFDIYHNKGRGYRERNVVDGRKTAGR